jgi:hypothetical protein
MNASSSDTSLERLIGLQVFVFFSDILRRDMNVRATTQSIQNVLEEAAIQHGKENSFSAK